jgi:hypothetical protein
MTLQNHTRESRHESGLCNQQAQYMIRRISMFVLVRWVHGRVWDSSHCALDHLGVESLNCSKVGNDASASERIEEPL